jgi:hypothetical protein
MSSIPTPICVIELARPVPGVVMPFTLLAVTWTGSAPHLLVDGALLASPLYAATQLYVPAALVLLKLAEVAVPPALSATVLVKIAVPVQVASVGP